MKVYKIFLVLVLTVFVTFAQASSSIIKGWNLLGAKSDVNVSAVFGGVSGIISVWGFDNHQKKWRAFTNDETLNSKIKNSNSVDFLNTISNGDGYWIYAQNNITADLNLTAKDVNTSSIYMPFVGWNLLGAKKDIDMSLFNEPAKVIVVWDFNNTTKKWSAFSPDINISNIISSSQVPIISKINSGSGYWIKTKETASLIENILNSNSFSLDESSFADTSNFQVLNGKSNNPVVNLSINQNLQPLQIPVSKIITTLETNSSQFLAQQSYHTTLTQSEVTNKIGKPLYIGGKFVGIIEGYNAGDISVKNAAHIKDVYSKFDIKASNDKIIKSLQRAIKGSGFGKYDYMNKEPLKVSIKKRSLLFRPIDGEMPNDPTIVIEFPKGYTIPLRALKRTSFNADCTLSEAMCDASFNYSKSWDKDFGKTLSAGSVTFTTAGSKIEIGLGAYIRAMYDYNTIGTNKYYFEFKPSVYYLVNLEASIKGGSVSAAEKTFDIVKDGLNIPIPLYEGVILNLNLKPEVVIGLENAPHNKNIDFSAKIHSDRTGYVKLVYTNGGSSITKGITDNADPLNDKGKLTLHVDTGTDEIVGYLFPEIAVRPQLSFAKIDEKVNIAYVRNGVRVDTKIKGLVMDDWIVDNDKIDGSAVEDVFLKTYLYGLVDYKWDIKVGDKDIWSNSDWSEIYKSPTLNILEWMSQFLQIPKIITNIKKDGTRELKFDIRSTYKDNIRFYYTLDGTDIDKTVINSDRDHTPYKMWKTGDVPATFSGDKTIKARAVLFTDEIPEKQDTLWKWGMSISKQTQKDSVDVHTPTISPTSKDFTGTINVNLSQNQNYKILYSTDNGISFSECGSGSCSKAISKTTPFIAKAVKNFNGKDYFSGKVAGYYRKCQSDEGLSDNGKCVTKCPYLWDVSYDRSNSLETDYQLYTNIFIYPREYFRYEEYGYDPVNTNEYEACKNYIENPKTDAIYFHYHIIGDDPKNDIKTGDISAPPSICYFGMPGCGDPSNGYPVQSGSALIKKIVYDKINKGASFSLGDSESKMRYDDVLSKDVLITDIIKMTFTKREYTSSNSGASGDTNSTNDTNQSSTTDPTNNSDNNPDNGGSIDGNYNDKVINWDITLNVQAPARLGGEIPACTYKLEWKNIPIDCKYDLSPTSPSYLYKTDGTLELLQPDNLCLQQGTLTQEPILTKVSGCSKTANIQVDTNLQIAKVGNQIFLSTFLSEFSNTSDSTRIAMPIITTLKNINFVDNEFLDNSSKDIPLSSKYNVIDHGITITTPYTFSFKPSN
jgi:hypothetical protein